MAHDLVKLGMRLFNDLFAAYYFFWPMKNKSTGKIQKTVGYISLWMIAVTMWPNNFWPYYDIGSAAVRFILRMLSYFFFMTLVKEGVIRDKLYYAVLLTIVYTNFTNIFMASPFLEFRLELVALFKNPIINIFFVHIVQFIVLFLILWILRKNCEFYQKKEQEIFILGLYAFIAVVIVYMKQSMKDRVDYGMAFQAMSEISIYYFAVVVLVFFSVIMIERFERTERTKKELEMTAILQNYRYEALLEKEKAEDRFRFLKHDMKNHLSAIKSLADDNKKVRTYIEELQGRMEKNQVVVETGNRMLNGLMSEKIRVAREYGIHMHVNMDFSRCTFIREIDICTMVSNALDNAVEASIQVL